MKRYNLKFWRIRKGLTQAELSGRLGITPEYYKAVENGKYNPSAKITNRFKELFLTSDEETENLFKLENEL